MCVGNEQNREAKQAFEAQLAAMNIVNAEINRCKLRLKALK